MDSDGYLYFSGRITEIINRGGEKIALGEIDDVLRSHPSIVDAATFSIPHPSLGEDVAAAVVVRDDALITEQQIRDFAACRLVQHKVPKRFLFVSSIPTGPYGRPLRSELQACLAASDRNGEVSGNDGTETHTERVLLKIWEEVLKPRGLSVQDDFFQLGGDSIKAVQIRLRISKALGVCPSLLDFYSNPTVAALARIVDGLRIRRASTFV